MRKIILTLTTLLLMCVTTAFSKECEVTGPDLNLRVKLDIKGGNIIYSVTYKDKIILEDSPLGLLTNEGDFTQKLSFVGSEESQIDRHYTQDRIKKSYIHYKANELIYTIKNSDDRNIDIVFRVSNNDIAFQYRIPEFGEGELGKTSCCVVERELTGFDFPSHTTTFLAPMMEPMTAFKRTAPSYETMYGADQQMGGSSKHGYVFPALFKVGENGWALISETGVGSLYCGAHLGEGTKEGLYSIEYPDMAHNNGFGSSGASIALPGETPWRTITVGDKLKPIVETTIPFDVVEPLYKPSMDYKMGRSVWSWIMWQDGSMCFEDQITYIDFAGKLGYEYILIDAWWDTRVGREEIKMLIDYAKNKGVGVFLWYNSNGAFNDAPQGPKNKMNRAIVRKQEMKWLQEIGVKGLKVDFFGGDKQETMRLYEDILSDANDYGLMINFHGCTLPRGWERMYPNYIGSEAVVASEMLIFVQDICNAEAYNATLHPFIRNSVGCMEFGGVLLNKRLNKTNDGGNYRRTTDAFQLATAILFQNPVQFFAMAPNNLKDAPKFAIDFMKDVPTTWDETLFIDGYPGKYCVLARRHGGNWYVAGVNAQKEPITVSIELPMLANQTVKHYNDDKKLVSYTNEAKIAADGKIEVTIQPNGGIILKNN